MSLKIITYIAKKPIIVQQTHNGSQCSRAVVEGGTIGYNFEQVFIKNVNDNWCVCLTDRIQFLKWLEDGYIKPGKRDKLPSQGHKENEALKKKIEAHQRKKVKTEPAIPDYSI